MQNFNERLELLRIKKDVYKKDIACATGLSIMSFWRYENGERVPDMNVLIALADYFDVSLDYLVGRSDNPARR